MTDEQKKSIVDVKHSEKVGFFKLFRFANRFDKTLMIVGSIAAALNGLTTPLFGLLFGQMADKFSPDSTGQQIVDSAGKQSLYLVYVGIASFILSWIQMGCWMVAGERQAIKCRKEYFKATISQEIGWFDKQNPNEMTSRISQECFYLQGAIGEKVPTFILTIFNTIGGFAVGYIRGWNMALVATAALPVIVIGSLAYTIVLQQASIQTSKAYAQGSALAEQSLNSVKTIKSLNGENFELANYSKALLQALKIATKFSILAGIGLGLVYSTMYLDYALSFWYGAKLIDDQTINDSMDRVYSVGDVMVVFFCILIGGFSLGQAGPCLKNFALGQQAGYKIFKILDRKPEIQNPQNPKKISNLRGQIQLKDIEFSYPAKRDIMVHRKLNLTINANEKTALVGESGCGKSTVMQLIERFYDPDNGEVIIDGVNVKDLDFVWLRKNIGYVGQEPVLYATSIRENLKFGKEDATEAEMIDALKQANAWEFVSHLENKLDTFVGNSGGQLSGGQKQRICIARAILKNPPILLLDEATSALDRKNEALIQATLDEVSKGRTTIIIAHRLTTIQNADRILVLDRGQLVEQGSYEFLINNKGKFEALAKNQISQEQEEDNENNELQKEDNIKLGNKNSDKNSHTKESTNKMRQVQPEAIQVETQRQPLKSNNDQQQEEEKKEVIKESKDDVSIFKKLFALNKPEQGYFYFGLIIALINGTSFPLSGLIMGEFIDALARKDDSDFRDKTNKLALYFVILAVCIQVGMQLQIYFFTVVGEGLTLRMRKEVYNKIMRLPCAWFDRPENNPGSISQKLASDGQLINQMTSNIAPTQFFNISCFIVGMVIAFVYSWRVTLIGLATSPLMIISGQLQAQFVEGFSENNDSAYKDSGKIIMETVTNIRTVASFCNESKLLEFLSDKLKTPYMKVKRKGQVSGLLLGFSQFSLFAVYAIVFYTGAIFHRDNGVTTKDMFVSIFTVLFAAMGVGYNNQFMSDIGAAKNAAKNLFAILESKDEVQLFQERIGKAQLYTNVNLKGNIVFKNVTFKYPSRDAIIVQNLSLNIQAGQKVAFVGPSGSGKSSIIQLLLRFYDNYEGEIFVDGINLREYDVHEYRKNFGAVNQEPILFNGTIQENIQYNTEGLQQEDIKEAARKANALHFIESDQFDNKDSEKAPMGSKILGSGFQRLVGPKGSQISGGQKQRIAIARAIIKNPNILLLDEATSALDPQNESVVQEALDSIMKGKTSINIAHRLSTIKDSDQIFVIESGKLVEQGNFDQLMENKNYFYRLYNC